MKNVAGYDLGKLQIGALGTLGVIVQATFKIAPLPAKVATGHVLGAIEPLLRVRDALEELRLPIQALTLRTNPGLSLWMLNVRFAGGEAAVARSVEELRRAVSDEGQTLQANDSAWEAQEAAIYRPDVPLRVHATITPTTVAPVAQAFAHTGASIACYPSVGVIDAAWDGRVSAQNLLTLRKLCVDAGGALVLHRASADLKRSAGVWGEPRGDFALMRRIKDELDPKHVLNPGRYLGDI